ncbi:MAG: PilZ domain-containing protein [Myxococcota bacterium]
MDEHSSQKLRAKRYTVANLNVIYDVDGAFWSGPVVDMSESGVFVETSHELPVGTRVVLVPDVSEDQALPFEIDAEVVRINQYDPDSYTDRVPGLAFRILGLRPDQYTLLGEFLRSRGVPLSGGRSFEPPTATSAQTPLLAPTPQAPIDISSYPPPAAGNDES